MRNYELVYYVAHKCVNYRDTGVSKNNIMISKIKKISLNNYKSKLNKNLLN